MAARAQAAVIDGLRDEIRRIERRPAQRAGFVSTGWPAIDALLPGGGFPRGSLSELAGGSASGKTAVALSTLAKACGERGIVAFVDGRGELYPPAVRPLGLDLERLLIVRPRGPAGAAVAHSALWAAEALLASGAFEAVAIDVAVELMRSVPEVTAAMLRRLRAAAEKGGCVALWLSRPGSVRAPAAVRVELAAAQGGWRARCAFARGAAANGDPEPGEGAANGVALLHPPFLEETDLAA